MDLILKDLGVVLSSLSVNAKYKFFCAIIALPFVIVAIQALYNVFRREKTVFAYKFLSVICFSAAVLTASFECYVNGELFSSKTEVILYLAVLFYVCTFLYAFLSFVNYFLVCGVKENERRKNTVKQRKNSVVNYLDNTLKNANDSYRENYGSFGADGMFNGYLNVKYVKFLIDKLNNCDITIAERKETEDFEVYLMNFAYRQPTEREREELSPKLNTLIRTLAKYQAV